MDARGEGDDVGVDGGAGDAIAALVERVRGLLSDVIDRLMEATGAHAAL